MLSAPHLSALLEGGAAYVHILTEQALAHLIEVAIDDHELIVSSHSDLVDEKLQHRTNETTPASQLELHPHDTSSPCMR